MQIGSVPDQGKAKYQGKSKNSSPVSEEAGFIIYGQYIRRLQSPCVSEINIILVINVIFMSLMVLMAKSCV